MEAQLYYGGSWHPGVHGRQFAIEDPATNEVIGHAVSADVNDLSLIIAAASLAFKEWSRTEVQERAHILQAIYRTIMEHQEELARLLTREEGKSLSESRSEIAYGARFFEFYAAQIFQAYGKTLSPPVNSRAGWTTKVPIGVAALITPWNYPFAMICRKMAPALAAGCTLIAT